MLIGDVDLVGNWVVNRTGSAMPRSGATAIGLMQDGKIAAGVLYEDFTQASIHATIAVDHGTVLSRDFVFAIFDYPFNQLVVEKILVYVNTANKESMRLAEHFGFVEEARVKGVFLDGDQVIYSITKDQCHLLKRFNHEQTQENSSA